MPSHHRIRTALAIVPALVGLLWAAAPARAELVNIVWSDAGQMDKRFDVPPGKFAELCGKLAKGSAVRWRYEAGGPMDFNIHYHVGKQVQFPVKHDATARSEGSFAAALDQDYCWMWTNKGTQPLSLQVTLTR